MKASRSAFRLIAALPARTAVSIYGMAVVCLAAGAVACRTPEPPPDRVDVREMSQSRLLLEATVETLRERGHSIDAASAQHRIVTTPYREVSDELRRRFVVRIVPVPGGASGLRVRAEYQRRVEEGAGRGGSGWKSLDRSSTRERAREIELVLGRAIEERFDRWERAAGQGP